MKRLNILITNWRAAGGLGWVAWVASTLDAAVWIKAYDGGRWLDLGQTFAEIAAELQRRGVDVGVWGYHYGYPAEVDRLLECYTYRHGIEGYEGPRAGFLIDAESEFETHEGQVLAWRQVGRIKAARLPVPVYYTSFALPDVHPDFPYGAFNELSGGHIPQVYYNHRGWPDPFSSVMSCVNQHYNRGLKLPGVMLPIYDAGSEQGWRPSPGDFHQATLAARMWNVPSVWTWTWEQHQREDWVALWHYQLLQGHLNVQ